MRIWKERKFYAFCPEDADEYIAVVLLENDVFLLVRTDGSARGSDGQIYVPVMREIPVSVIPSDLMFVDVRIPDDQIPPDDPSDSDLEPLGWTADADKTVIL